MGKRLNSPNDVVVKSDGSIWFTDPPFGILGHYEGHRAEAELPTNVYRIDPGPARPRRRRGPRPNGLCFSPDEKLLYVVESRGGQRRIQAFDVTRPGAACPTGRCSSTPARRHPGRHPLRRRRQPLVRLGWARRRSTACSCSPPTAAHRPDRLPERCANVCFGGRQRNRLFMAASQSMYALYVNTQGALGG